MGMLSSELSQHTGLLGLRVWVLVAIGVGLLMAFILFLLFFCLCLSKQGVMEKATTTTTASESRRFQYSASAIPPVSKDIRVDKVTPASNGVLLTISNSSEEMFLHVGLSLSRNSSTSSFSHIKTQSFLVDETSSLHSFIVEEEREKDKDKAIERDKERRVESMDSIPSQDNFAFEIADHSHSRRRSENSTALPTSMPCLGCGYWYTLRELQQATNGFTKDNIIGEGGYGIVYKGFLPQGSFIAVKHLLNNRGQAENEFRVEVEAIGRVRHKNLVRLLGYCVEGIHRMLIYEYVDNGNLEQWLHGTAREKNPLTWEARMKIMLGTAKALSYLHESLEPKVVHRDIKGSNILVDSQWNAKVSDFGLAILLAPEKSHITTRVMGTFGYVAPEYANTGLLNERSDIFSFGVLLVETITGRVPIDHARAPTEVNLLEWLKVMIVNKRSEEVLDPRLVDKPASRVLKKLLLIGLRCVDPNPENRPKMSDVVYMLEDDEYPHKDDRRHLRDRYSTEVKHEWEKWRVFNEDGATT